MKHILRFMMCEECADRQLPEVLDYCARTDTREVLIFTGNYDRQPSYQPMDYHRTRAAILEKWLAAFRARGIEAGINVLQTLGHIYYPAADQAKFGFRQRVNLDGVGANAGACSLDEGLRGYLGEVYRIYAALKPSMLYVDDDFRNWMQGPGCFCEAHIRAINAAAGTSLTREALRGILLDPDHPDHLRLCAIVQRVECDALTRLAAHIRESVDSVAPECPIGIMTMTVPTGWWGTDYAAIARALAGPRHAPIIRPQIGCYGEVRVSDMIGLARNPALVRQTMPDDTVVQPEIENYPYETWNKSAAFTRLQMLVPHFDGMHRLAINLFDYHGTPLSEYPEMIGMNARCAAYFTALEAAIPEGSRSRGIAVPMTPDGITRRRPEGAHITAGDLCGNDRPMQFVSRLGLPLGFDWADSPFVLLAGAAVDGFSDEALKTWLRRGAVIDRPAFEALRRRGLAGDIPVTFGEDVRVDDSGIETFFGMDGAGAVPELGGVRCRPVRFEIWRDGWAKTLSATNGEARVFSQLQNYRGDVITPLVLGVETAQGARYGVLAFSLDEMTDFLMLSAPRKKQLADLFEWVARRPLPVKCGSLPYLMAIYQPVADNAAVIGLINAASDPVDRVPLTLGRGEPSRIEALDAEGRWRPCEYADNTVQIGIPAHDALTLRAFW